MSGSPLKSASIIQLLAVAMLFGGLWMHFSGRIDGLEQRVKSLEADAEALAPLSKLMRGHQPGRATPHSYQAVQATGPTNISKPGVDNALAWCPNQEDMGVEWIELSYPQPVLAAELRIHASFNPGAVVRVLGDTAEGALREIWSGNSPTTPLQTIPLSPPVEISRIKLELDTSKIAGWNQIDAVALVDRAGTFSWAATATSSSYWGESETAPADPPQ